MPIIENRDPLEPTLDPDRGLAPMPTSQDFLDPVDGEDKPSQFDDTEVLSFLGEAKRLSRNYQQMAVMGDWAQSQAAYRSEHSSGSKYTKDQYKNRSKYFKPKTRAAVRKNLTATANAFFSSQDVMSCQAENDGDVRQRANAALIKEIINARFTSKTKRSGVPWFQIVQGARHDTQIMGVCVTKQTWRYKFIERTETRQEEQPVVIGGVPMMDPMTGQPMMEVVDVEDTVRDVTEDKPVITLLPAEMVLLDPSTHWIEPAQNSPTLIIIWPMHIDDVRAMMNEEKTTTPWRELTDEQLRQGYYSESEIMGIKSARDGNAPLANRQTSKIGGNRNEIVEVRECFFRRDDIDYHCWTVTDKYMLSDVAPTSEVYPAHRGTRPIVIGTDALEPHVLYPESHVAAWKQSQDEINDFTNLRMDATRQSAYPTAKVKAGKNIDYKAVQRRDGQGIILVREQDDVVWDRPPGPPAGIHQEVNLLSNDFDGLAGQFDQSSVQGNRQLNETVGGMQLIASNASATAEFDLRVFVETWAEPVLSQIAYLEQYYEDDATLIAVSGEKAKLFERFGVNEVTDELLESQIQLSMNIGIGASDPMQQLAKFKTVFDIATPMLSLAMKEGRAKINYEEIFSEIFGKGGYRNGADRFITISEGEEQQIPPEAVAQMKQMLEALQAENAKLKEQAAIKMQTEQMKIEDNQRGREADLAKTQMQEQGETHRVALDNLARLALQNDAQAFQAGQPTVAPEFF